MSEGVQKETDGYDKKVTKRYTNELVGEVINDKGLSTKKQDLV